MWTKDDKRENNVKRVLTTFELNNKQMSLIGWLRKFRMMITKYDSLIEKDHLIGVLILKDCSLWLMFRPPVQKPTYHISCVGWGGGTVSAQVVETSVTNNSPSQDSNHPDDLIQSRYVTPGFKEFSYYLNVEYFFLICFVKRAKLLNHDWSSDCLATAYSIKKLFFCNNGVSFRDSWWGIYQRIKGHEWKWKQEE